MKIDTGMIQYAHDFSVATFAKSTKLLSHQINDSQSTIGSGVIGGKDYIGMSKDSSISYDIGIIKPEEKKELEITILQEKIKRPFLTKEQIRFGREVRQTRYFDERRKTTADRRFYKRYLRLRR